MQRNESRSKSNFLSLLKGRTMKMLLGVLILGVCLVFSVEAEEVDLRNSLGFSYRPYREVVSIDGRMKSWENGTNRGVLLISLSWAGVNCFMTHLSSFDVTPGDPALNMTTVAARGTANCVTPDMQD